MTLDDFVTLAEATRKAQRDYFATRKPSALELSKEYERRLDAAIRQHRAGPDLFAEEPG